MANLGLGDIATSLVSGYDAVALEGLSDDSLLGILGIIDGLGANATVKDKARRKVVNAIKHKSNNVSRETVGLSDKALFEQRLNLLPNIAREKLQNGQWQLVPFIYYGVKPISGQNHVDLFKSGDNTIIGITNVVQGRMPAEDYFLCTAVRCRTAVNLAAQDNDTLKKAAWTHPSGEVVNGEWKMAQESTTYIDKSAASVFDHANRTDMETGIYKLPTPKMFYPQREIKVEFDFAGTPDSGSSSTYSAMRFELIGIKTTKA